MLPEHIDDFETHTAKLRRDVDAILEHAETLRDLAEDAKTTLASIARATSRLRRTDNADLMGPLNSLSAAHARHNGLRGALDELETVLSRFEDIARDVRLLHPGVVEALRQGVERSTAVVPEQV
jgi:hypothetical protein